MRAFLIVCLLLAAIYFSSAITLGATSDCDVCPPPPAFSSRLPALSENISKPLVFYSYTDGKLAQSTRSDLFKLIDLLISLRSSFVLQPHNSSFIRSTPRKLTSPSRLRAPWICPSISRVLDNSTSEPRLLQPMRINHGDSFPAPLPSGVANTDLPTSFCGATRSYHFNNSDRLIRILSSSSPLPYHTTDSHTRNLNFGAPSHFTLKGFWRQSSESFDGHSSWTDFEDGHTTLPTSRLFNFVGVWESDEFSKAGPYIQLFMCTALLLVSQAWLASDHDRATSRGPFSLTLLRSQSPHRRRQKQSDAFLKLLDSSGEERQAITAALIAALDRLNPLGVAFVHWDNPTSNRLFIRLNQLRRLASSVSSSAEPPSSASMQIIGERGKFRIVGHRHPWQSDVFVFEDLREWVSSVFPNASQSRSTINVRFILNLEGSDLRSGHFWMIGDESLKQTPLTAPLSLEAEDFLQSQVDIGAFVPSHQSDKVRSAVASLHSLYKTDGFQCAQVKKAMYLLRKGCYSEAVCLFGDLQQ